MIFARYFSLHRPNHVFDWWLKGLGKDWKNVKVRKC